MADRKPFEDAERFELEGDVPQMWVVLAITAVGGVQYALLAPEAMIANEAEGDMEVVVFEYRRDGDGHSSLAEVPDEATYEAVYREFASLMGLEATEEEP
jgi:hypothetical protein